MTKEKDQEEKHEEELKFPLYFKCPCCGSEERIIRKVADEEVKKGKMLLTTKVSCFQLASAISEALPLLNLPVPILLSLFDICAKCGCFYPFEVQKTRGMTKTAPPGASSPMRFPPRLH